MSDMIETVETEIKDEATKIVAELEPSLATAVQLFKDFGRKVDDLANWVRANAPHAYETFEAAKTALESEIKKIVP